MGNSVRGWRWLTGREPAGDLVSVRCNPKRRHYDGALPYLPLPQATASNRDDRATSPHPLWNAVDDQIDEWLPATAEPGRFGMAFPGPAVAFRRDAERNR